MYSMKKIVSLSAGLIVLGTLAVLVGTGTVGASPRLNSVVAAPPTPAIPVTVTNTPLPVSGTVTASLNGTPTVSVASPVTVSGSVGITGNPAVTLLNNNEITPVYVETEANPAYFVQTGTCALSSTLTPYQSTQNNCTTFTSGGFGVNYRLAVQNTSMAVQVPAGTVVQNAYLGMVNGASVAAFSFIPLTKMGSDQNFDYYVGTANVHLYYATNQPLGCGITTSPSPNAVASNILSIQCTTNGHLVPGLAD
ncbi:MAG TPA: hypothetical protein VK466_05910 [Terriglobales bacterium]|nr:hypothetical protein [Terriglobales bacterium]